MAWLPAIGGMTLCTVDDSDNKLLISFCTILVSLFLQNLLNFQNFKN